MEDIPKPDMEEAAASRASKKKTLHFKIIITMMALALLGFCAFAATLLQPRGAGCTDGSGWARRGDSDR
jgi:hypothetical protein